MSRDRHDRGLRGPLATRNRLTGSVVPLRRAPSGREFFESCVADAVDRINRHAPQVLVNVEVGVEEVPFLQSGWISERIPLAAAVEADGKPGGRVVLYRRPLEHRAATRHGLQILVHRTLVEQLSALTTFTVEQIDPEGLTDED